VLFEWYNTCILCFQTSLFHNFINLNPQSDPKAKGWPTLAFRQVLTLECLDIFQTYCRVQHIIVRLVSELDLRHQVLHFQPNCIQFRQSLTVISTPSPFDLNQMRAYSCFRRVLNVYLQEEETILHQCTLKNRSIQFQQSRVYSNFNQCVTSLLLFGPSMR